MFSIKRPLRFLIHKLELEEDQVHEIADTLSDFKIEKDVADIERRRAKKVLAAALKADVFDREKAEEGVEQQVEAERRLRSAFVDSLERVHAALKPEQREKLAFLFGSLDIEV